MTKRPLVPRFLNKLDNYLLVNRPTTWTARAHLAFWYALLFAAALTLVCFTVPNDPRERSVVHYWVVAVSVIIFIGFIGWLIYLLRFNVFKRYGHLPPVYGIKTFFLYAVAIGSMIACAFIPPVVESIRANNAYTNEEIVNDANTINLDLCRLERDSLVTQWSTDTSIVRDIPRTKNNPAYTDDGETDGTDRYTDDEMPAADTSLSHISTKQLQRKLKYADSVIRVNDSMYIFYICPDYKFINMYREDDYSKVKSLGSTAIFDKVLRNYRPPDRAAVKREYDVLFAKYQTGSFPLEYIFPDDYVFNRQEYFSHTKSKYNTNEIDYSMGNLISRKYRWKGNAVRDSLWLFYYLALVLTLFVFVFRHSTIKTFFLSLLTTTVLAILTSLFFVFTRIESDRAVFQVLLFYFWLFVIIALTIRLDPVRRAWKGIALNLFVLCLPYVAVIGVGLYYSYVELVYPIYRYPGKFIHRDLHMHIAEITGFVLLVILLDTVIKPLYRRWYALPEQ